MSENPNKSLVNSRLKDFVLSKYGFGLVGLLLGFSVAGLTVSSKTAEPLPVPTMTVAGPVVTVTETPEPLPAVTVTKKASETLPANKKIEEGTWTVGVDVLPGTYRVSEPVTSDMGCYWAILKSGTNGNDIVANDNVSGGRPTISIRNGQDVENSDCGTFIKIS